MYIDGHVHLRDFKQAHKETIAHGLTVARDVGIDAVFDMPNTDPPITTREAVLQRLQLARAANVPEVFYGLYMGLTADPEQVKRAVAVVREFPQVIGMKLYAGHSVGNLGVTREEDQQVVYQTLAQEGYDGIVAVHCEKEAKMDSMQWNPQQPITHCYARPEAAEVASLQDQLRFSSAAHFKGGLHITHISSPRAVTVFAEAKGNGVNISCGVCPHHFIYDWSKMREENGLLWKMNPPLREPFSRNRLFQDLRTGIIDWIETDHAPHSLVEKTGSPYMSGIPGLAWWPLFAEFLRQNSFSDRHIENLTFHNIARRFKLDLTPSRCPQRDRRADYPFDPYLQIAQELTYPWP